MTPSPTFPRILAGVLSVAAVVWMATLFAVAWTPPGRLSPMFRGTVHAVGRLVCHQRPERSFHSHGRPFPVCARCTGLYVSGAVGAMAAWFGLARAPRRTRLILGLAAIPTVLTLTFEWLGLAAASNAVRAASAVPFGGGALWLFVRMLRSEGVASTCAMIA